MNSRKCSRWKNNGTHKPRSFQHTFCRACIWVIDSLQGTALISFELFTGHENYQNFFKSLSFSWYPGRICCLLKEISLRNVPTKVVCRTVHNKSTCIFIGASITPGSLQIVLISRFIFKDDPYLHRKTVLSPPIIHHMPTSGYSDLCFILT